MNSSPTITNCTISNNSANYGGGIDGGNLSSPTVVNSILWGNIAGYGTNEICLSGDHGSIDITYSDIQGGWEGEWNIDADPLFVDDTSEDISLRNYHLTADSPCIDAGTNEYLVDDVNIVPEYDIDGDTRDSYPDIGSDEYTE